MKRDDGVLGSNSYLGVPSEPGILINKILVSDDILSDQALQSYFRFSSSTRPLAVTVNMPVTVEDLERAIRAAFPVSHLVIEDQSSGCGSSYAIFLVSEVCVRNELKVVIVM
jgi:hypothetical protein